MAKFSQSKQYQEPTMSTEHVFQGRVISLQVDTIELPNGKMATREIVRHPGAAAVIPLIGDKMVVVEQYRKPFEKFQVEIPAGKLDKGEDPAVCAARELEEETGYKVGKLTPLHAMYTSPGFADELLHIFVAEELTKGDSRPDEDEFLAVHEITLEEALQLIQVGMISDAKTLLAVYAWRLYRLTGNF